MPDAQLTDVLDLSKQQKQKHKQEQKGVTLALPWPGFMRELSRLHAALTCRLPSLLLDGLTD